MALIPQFILFFLSYKIEGESAILFAVLYVGLAALSAFFFGTGPGFIAGITAAFSVDFHYFQPTGSIFTGGSSYEFFSFTLLVIFITTRISSLLSKALLDTIESEKRAATAVHDRERLLATIAHDLRQPVQALALQSELIQQQIQAGKDQVALTVAKKFSESITQLDRMIEDLVDSSRIQNGKLTVNMRPGDLRAVATRVVDASQPLAQNKSIDLRLDQRPAGDNTQERLVLIDENQIRRVFANLIGNAIKFTPPHGMIRVHVELTETGAVACVRDSGPGIDPQNVPKLFERNWQAGETAHLGSGLGLFIAKGIIAAHGGELWYASDARPGAKFCFRLPLE